jgi:adhesin/invasin
VTITATDASNPALPLSQQATLTISSSTVGAPSSVTIESLSPSPVTAGSTSQATAVVQDAHGLGVSNQSVQFSVNNQATGTPCMTDGSGTCSVTLGPFTAAGTQSITATDTTPSSPITSAPFPLPVNPGPATTVTLSPLSPGTITAGNSESVTATATDANGNPVPGDSVQFAANAQAMGAPCTTDSSGSCGVTLGPFTVSGTENITATDTITSVTSAPQALTVTPGQASKVTVSLNPNPIPADGSTTSTATAKVTDANGNGVPGESLQFSVNNQATGAPCTADSSGSCSITLPPSTVVGTESVTATDTTSSITSAPVTLTFTSTSGTAANIVVTLSSPSIIANGQSTATATAKVTDVNGNPVTGDNLVFGATPNAVAVGQTNNHHDGTYSAIVTSTSQTTQVTVTITATDKSVPALPPGSGTLVLNPPSAANSVTVSVSPGAIPADGGGSHAFAGAAVQDSGGNPVAHESIEFFVNGQLVQPTCVTVSDGSCHIQLNSTSVIGQETITAYDSAAGLTSWNSVILWMVQVPPPPPTTTTPVHPAITLTQIESSLAGVLKPHGTAASIRALRKTGTYAFSYQAPGAGKLKIDWYSTSGKKQKLIGAASATAGKAGKVTARLRLTTLGRSLLKHAKHVNVTADVAFTPGGGTAGQRVARFTLH